MKRALALLALAGAVTLTGCNVLSPSIDTAIPEYTEQTPGGTTPATGSHTESPKQQFEPENRLIVDKWYDGPVRLEMYQTRDRFDRSLENESAGIEFESVTYGPDRSGEVHVREFVPDGYVVLHVDGAVAWEGYVSPWNHVELVVRRDGSVTVREAITI